jgi:membrane associated rhomboid family serine protease
MSPPVSEPPVSPSRQLPPRQRSEPALFAPPFILALMAFMLGLHAYRALWLGLYEDADIAILKPLAFVAARFNLGLGFTSIGDILRDVASADPALRPLKRFLAQAFVIQSATSDDGFAPWTLVTYAFLHAGWEHVIFNTLWLLVFGSPVLLRFGVARFALFFALTAAAAAVLQAAINPTDVSVLIGASGAVSGLTAAALRFAFTGPGFGARMGDEVVKAPAAPLLEVMRDKRVMVFVAVWFGLNLLAGLGIPVSGSADARIAWEAHVGGFLAGLLLFPLLDPVRRRRA